jgi:exopolysaccharide production protein ExoQ
MSRDSNIVESNYSVRPAGAVLAFCVGFYFAFRLIIPVFLIRIMGTDPQTGSETGLALNFLLLCIICFAHLGAAGSSRGHVLHLSSIRWVLVFLTLSGCSLLWSATASPTASTAYWCGTVSDVSIAVLMLRTNSALVAANSIMKGFVCGSCCIALIAWIMPAQYDLRLGDEDYFNSNTIGNLCAFALFFAQYLMRRKQGQWAFATFFLVITLLRSLSKTTIVAFLVSEGYLLIEDRSLSRKTKTLLTVALVLVVLVFWGLFEAYYDFYTTNGNQAETLTGRTAIWAYVFDAALAKPWIGHGFDSMWKVVPLFGTFEARHAENELLQQFYSYGVAGIVMLCSLYGSLHRKIRRLSQGPLKIIFASILLFVLVRGLAEAEPFDLLLPLWAIVLLTMLVECADRAEQEVHAVSISA